MVDRFSTFVALRYLTGRKGITYLSFVSSASYIGLALGVMVLTIVVSVMNGFDRELKQRILGAAPHLVINMKGGIQEDVRDYIRRHPMVAAEAPYGAMEAMLIAGGQSELVAVQGVDPALDAAVSIVGSHMVAGDIHQLTENGSRIILGRALALRLGAIPGDLLTLVIPQASPGGQGVRPRIERVAVAGVFRLDSELDSRLALMNVKDLLAITGAGSPGIRIRLHDLFDAGALQQQLMDRFSPGIEVNNWTVEYGDFFETVRMEKIMMFLLLSLIITIAAFNIISSLSILVSEKRHEISVLRTMGASPGQVMLIFITQGSLIGVIGCSVGILLGVPLAMHIGEIIGVVEDLFQARVLSGTYFDRIPSDLRLPDVLAIIAVSLAISVLATLYPAFQAAALKPAEVLRTE